MKLVSIMWGAYTPLLKKALQASGIEFKLYTTRNLDQNPEKIDDALQAMREADGILLYHSSEMYWDQIDKELKSIGEKVPIISLGSDPSYWIYSTVKPEIVSTCQLYVTYNGEENFTNLVGYVRNKIFHEDLPVVLPIKLPWEGLYHPEAKRSFADIDDYLEWHSSRTSTGPWVGILFSRVWWASGNLNIEDTLIRSLEQEGMNVIPVFSYSIRDDGLGTKSMGDVVAEFLVNNGAPRVDAIIKLVPFLLGSCRGEEFSSKKTIASSADLLKKLNIPIFTPIITYYQSLDQWREGAGLTFDTGWAVAMPEFDGVIEPVFIGSSCSTDDADNPRLTLPERCRKVTLRVKEWIALAKKPVHERKVTFILNNNPCANAEANVGAAAHFDSLESVARILQEMKNAGYNITPPNSGKELIETIMGRKAISEFRWTTVEDIVAKGGVLMQMDMSDYLPYFSTLPSAVQERVNTTWGAAPGLGMVYQNKILITGVSYGNATIHVQPKRGCYGARCDGEVCKILHDPECPPPHQYLATYYWVHKIFGADVIVHVGTHGNLEFLPGKGVGLSENCFPDVSIGTIPHLYIYNSDNPPEGTIAKRRSYATLVDHMQTVLIQGGLYEGMEELEILLNQYENAKNDPARSHALQHLIMEALASTNLDKDIHLDPDMPLALMVSKTHEALSRIRNTKIPSGMHIFGQLPEGDKRYEFINSIIRFDSGNPSPRRTIANVMGLDLSKLLADQGAVSEEHGISNGALLEKLEEITKEFIRVTLQGSPVSYTEIFSHPVSDLQAHELDQIKARIYEINKRIEESREVESLLNGFNGGFIPAGPSGIISRGHEEVLPTGRNFYSLDPYSVPTKSAWRVGQRLSESLLKKYESEEGKIPENVAFYWMCTDVMSADGEVYAQILALLGVEPVWLPNGQVKSFRIVPLETLGRPRIDVTIRTSGILRDNFSNCYELVDEAVQAVSALDEPVEQNFVRKHALEKMKENGGSWRDATFRVFSSQPGTYLNGVELAVYASSWKEEADLADIFVAFNGYAYGKDVQGKAAQDQLASSLSTVEVTFNKVHDDEYDLLGCCCYFGTHGGMTAAARHYSGKETKAYYGDTREPEHVEVRDLADELRRVVRTKLLNPKWIEGMKEHGYKGAADIMKRVVRVYGWEASTQEVDDWIFNDIAETFVNDAEMREFFEENNPYAIEEIARRLLEAEQRGLWDADEEVLDNLKNNYLQIESWMEDQVGEGDYQGGSIDIFGQEDVPAWSDQTKDLMAKVREKFPRTVKSGDKVQ
jgi:magnesium chelatase, H subunit